MKLSSGVISSRLQQRQAYSAGLRKSIMEWKRMTVSSQNVEEARALRAPQQKLLLPELKVQQDSS
jgi:hypothetical protein